MAASIQVAFVGDTKSLDKAFTNVKKNAAGTDSALGKTGKQSSGLSKGLGVLAKAAGAVGVAMIAKNLLSDAFEGMKRSEAASAQLTSGMQSMGNAANTTVKGMENLATGIERTTGVEAELVMEGQALLQTFGNIRNEAGLNNDVFNRATEAAVDLSAKGFGSVTDASKMLGKALNDPVKGISAMAKAGVSFSEDQKKMIKSLVDTGDTLGAQKIILAEVEKQVGGAAAAYGETLPGKIDRANAAVGEITESLMASAAPALEKVAGAVVGLATSMNLLPSIDINLGTQLLELGDNSLTALDNYKQLEQGLSNTGWLEELGYANQEAVRKVQELDYALVELVSNGNADRAGELFKEAADKVLAGGGTMDDVHAKFPQYIQAQKDYEASVTLTGDAEADAINMTEAWASELENLDSAISELSTSFDGLLGRFLSAEEASINAREAVRSLAEVVAEGAKENENAAEYQDRVASALIRATQAANDEYEALVRSGEKTGEVAERNQFLTDSLNDVAGQFPGLRGQITEYIGRLDAVPTSVKTQAEANTPDGQITNYLGRLDDVPGQVRTVAVADTAGAESNISRLFNLIGSGPVGVFRAITERFHSGGIIPGSASTESLAILRGGERVIPNGRSGGSGAPIVVVLQVDGREMASVVAKHQGQRGYVAGAA